MYQSCTCFLLAIHVALQFCGMQISNASRFQLMKRAMRKIQCLFSVCESRFSKRFAARFHYSVSVEVRRILSKKTEAIFYTRIPENTRLAYPTEAKF